MGRGKGREDKMGLDRPKTVFDARAEAERYILAETYNVSSENERAASIMQGLLDEIALLESTQPFQLALVYNDQGDWTGIYRDGVLVEEGHSLRNSDVLRIAGVTHTTVYDVAIPETIGSLPKTFDEVASLGGTREEITP